MLDNPPARHDVIERLNGHADLSSRRKPPFKSHHVRVKMLSDEGYFPAGQGSNPVEMYYERFSAFDQDAKLTHPLEDDLMAQAGHPHFRDVVVAYSMTNYKQRNIKLIMDWLRDGIPDYRRNNHNESNHAVRQPPGVDSDAGTSHHLEWPFGDPTHPDDPY